MLKASSRFGFHNRVPFSTRRNSPSVHTPFVCMMRSSTWNFFHRPVAMGPTPPTQAITTHDPTMPVNRKANSMDSIAQRRTSSDGEGRLLRFRRRSNQVHNQAEVSFGQLLLISPSSTTRFRKLLSKERNPPIERVIETGVVSRQSISFFFSLATE